MNCKEWRYLYRINRHLLDFTYYDNTREIQKSLQYNHDPNAKVIHHLRDTEEQRKYNDEHYELWGHNLDGTFEYGKYVIFVTETWHYDYHHHSEETRSKISIANRGKKRTLEQRRAISERQKGKSLSEEHRKHISDGNKGKVVSSDTKNKISAANKGRIFSRDHRHKLRLSHLGIKFSEEHKTKISEGNKGKVVSEETKKKISDALSGENHYLYGKHLSDEHKKHISDSHVGKCWITDEGRRRISEYAKNHIVSDETRALLKERHSARLQFMSEKYSEYKLSGGTLPWNKFQKEFNNMTDEFIAWQNLHKGSS